MSDARVRKLAQEDFAVSVLRPPMIYGRGSKGNYPVLSKMARRLPLFPEVDNRRSMLLQGVDAILKSLIDGKFLAVYAVSKSLVNQIPHLSRKTGFPLIPRGTGSIGMAVNYCSFTASGWFWNLYHNIHADLVFTYEVSPMTQALIGCWYARKHNVPHFLYVQDLWPENVETVTGIHNRFLIKPIDLPFLCFR